MVTTVKLEGKQELEKRLGKVAATHIFAALFDAIAIHIKGKVNVYPAATIANSPSNPTGRWYERGYGTKTATGKGHKTSQTLGKKWYDRKGGDSLEVGNTTSYAPYVQGRDLQAWFHEARGWKTLEDTAEAESGFIEKVGQAIINERLGE